MQEGFWDDMEKSQKILKNSKALKNKLERYENLKNDYDDTLMLIDMAIEEDDESMYPELSQTSKRINKELEAYNPEIAKRPQVIAANKIDAIYRGDGEEDPVDLIRKEFEPKGIEVFAISAVSGEGVKPLLYKVNEMLSEVGEEPTVFEQEYFPELKKGYSDEPYTVEYDEEEDEYVVEGPRIEKMLGYTNLESEKGFTFFQNFLKETGILEELEQLGIQEGDTVRMYGLSFDYYK